MTYRIPVARGFSAAQLWLRGTNTGLLGLALVVGAGAGGAAVGFRYLMQLFTQILSGHADYAGLGPVANPHVSVLGRYFVILAPVVAGLLYGPLVHCFAREARGHGVPEVMYAVARRGGRIAPQVAGVKALASALCIGGGGSVGREGPIVQIGSALGSTLGAIGKLAEPRVRVLVACGAAGGIAATFNAPLAGVFFAMELILRDFTAEAFGMVVVSAVTASVIGRAVFGDHAFLTLTAFHVTDVGQYGLFAVLGLLAGGIGVVFTRVLYWIEDACDWAWRGPEWARPAVGGVLLGGLLLVLPEMYGVGYPVLGNAVAGNYGIAFVLLLVVAKMAATSLTIGIGGSGGVFAPSLFIGAAFGSAFGQVVHSLLPGVAGPSGAYALIGMGAVFAGAARAPITAVIIMFELTGEYTIILPLMIAIVLATGLSHLLSHDTIYTLKLRRRGVDLDHNAQADPFADTRVDSVMLPVGATVSEDTRLAAAADLLSVAGDDQLAVVNADGAYVGVLTARVIADAMADGAHDDAVVASITDYPGDVRSDLTLYDALDVLAVAHSAIPVVDPNGREVVGWLTHQRVLAAQHGVGGRSAEAAV